MNRFHRSAGGKATRPSTRLQISLPRYAGEQGLLAKTMTIAELLVQLDEPQS
jgi:hypothetical protein